MFKQKKNFIIIFFILVIIVGYILNIYHVFLPRQSTIRLKHKLELKQLLIAIDSYHTSFNNLPKSMEDLISTGKISKNSDMRNFKLSGGLKGTLAFQTKPCRSVLKGEPWGHPGEIAKHDIPAARLVLFLDRSIKFVDELEFQDRFSDLLNKVE